MPRLARFGRYLPVKIICEPAEPRLVPLVRSNHRRGNSRMRDQPGQVTHLYYRRGAFPPAVTAITGNPSLTAKFLVTPRQAPHGPAPPGGPRGAWAPEA